MTQGSLRPVQRRKMGVGRRGNRGGKIFRPEGTERLRPIPEPLALSLVRVRTSTLITLKSLPSMKASTRNIAAGDANIVKGKTKEITGKVVRSDNLQAKGVAQEVAGDIQKAVGRDQKSRGE